MLIQTSHQTSEICTQNQQSSQIFMLPLYSVTGMPFAKKKTMKRTSIRAIFFSGTQRFLDKGEQNSGRDNSTL